MKRVQEISHVSEGSESYGAEDGIEVFLVAWSA